MDNYLSDFDRDERKERGGLGIKGVLLCCLLCVVVSAVVSGWVFTNMQPAADGGSVAANDQTMMNNLSADGSSAAGGGAPALVTDDSASDENSIAVGKNVSPAVVFISNIQNARTFMTYSPWSYSRSGGDTYEAVASTGSGVIYSADGYIITNNHVVEGAEKISVTLYNGNSYIAEVVGTDARTDLAVVKIDTDEALTVAKFGDSDDLVVGETAIAIGNPGGENFANSLTKGVISGLNRSVSTSGGSVLTVVQTDAAINPGNSGGALCNAAGEVIGINTIKISMDGYEGMGFAIPSNDVLTICDELIASGKILRPALGVGIISDVTPQIAYYNNLSVDYGVMIAPFMGGAAAKAGLENYDIVIAVDDVEIETYSELQNEIFAHKIGDVVRITVMRGQEKLELEVTLQELVEE